MLRCFSLFISDINMIWYNAFGVTRFSGTVLISSCLLYVYCIFISGFFGINVNVLCIICRYEHEYTYPHDSPSHIEPLESRTIVNNTVEHNSVPFAPPDIRNLQKERVHLLEQLEDCPSSGDEVHSPKKRLKLDGIEGVIATDVIIEANRDHRKVMEVRRSSDASITKHHSRRPSIDGSIKHRDMVNYMPHAVCKRRKTGGSDGGPRTHHYDHTGENVGESRPGTPLCDERPEHFAPSEPRRQPREREGPLTLPLPRFAAQIMQRCNSFKKEILSSSPPTLATSPRTQLRKSLSPSHVQEPTSPHSSRAPSPTSTSTLNLDDSHMNLDPLRDDGPPSPISSDSEPAHPTSPNLEDRIRELEEKYEKWSGTRALSSAGSEILDKLDPVERERFKIPKSTLLDVNPKQIPPSDIVNFILSKRRVFDEDSKRLESCGEKYENYELSTFKRKNSVQMPVVPIAVVAAPPPPPMLKVLTPQQPKTPTMLSPRAAG